MEFSSFLRRWRSAFYCSKSAHPCKAARYGGAGKFGHKRGGVWCAKWGVLLRAPARTRAPQQSPGLLLPWRVALFESLNNCRTKKARQKALLSLLERITRLARCASARTGTHAGTATVHRTVATLTGCPVRVSQYCRTKKARQKALLFLLERITRLELATSTLARWRSTR